MSEEIPEIWKAINLLANNVGVLAERVKKLEEGDLGLWHGKGMPAAGPEALCCEEGGDLQVFAPFYDRLFERRKREE